MLERSFAGPLSLALVLAPASAAAGVSDDYGGLVLTIANNVGLKCGPIANIIEEISDYECTLTGLENGAFGTLCLNYLDANCAIPSADVPDFLTDVQPIFDASCASCHGESAATVDLSVDAYDDIVDVPSSQLPTMDFVEPGDTANSYLWHKINGTQADVGGSGNQMPLAGCCLSSEELAIIEAWIAGGAPDSEAAYTFTLADDVQPLFSASCSAACHQTAGGTNGSLVEGDIYTDQVDVPSSDVPTMDRIEPGDPENSYLYHKVNGTHLDVGGAGSQMPLTGCCLSSEDIDMIYTWILEGAPE